MVKALKIIIVNKAEAWFDRYLFKTAPRALLVGLLLTVMVQSSSITTSLAVPLAGAGLLTLIQIFPYTLGANLGTDYHSHSGRFGHRQSVRNHRSFLSPSF